MKATRVLLFLILVLLSAGTLLANGGEERASVNGKYHHLLKTIHCPVDKATYGEFNDYGYYSQTEWCGDEGPAGYWVYVYPNWYIWATLGEEPPSSEFEEIN